MSPTELARPPDDSDLAKRYRYWRIRVLYSTTAGYAIYYLVRNNLPMAIKALSDEFHFTNAEVGRLLSITSLVYGISKFLSGMLGDRLNPRYLLSGALAASALFNLAFGTAGSLAAFIGFWALNSVVQGVGVPPCSRLLTHWFDRREIGRAWGIWNASHQIGGAIIAVVAGLLVNRLGWRSAFYLPAMAAILGALWLAERLRDSPESMGLPAVEDLGKGRLAAPAGKEDFWPVFRDQILANPWVWLVSFANFFVYVVRIGILSWGPKFLVEKGGFTLVGAGTAISAFEIAGIFGALGAGWLSDTVTQGRRGPVSTLFLGALAVTVYLLATRTALPLPAIIVLFGAMGFLVYGPQMLIAVAAADFATKKAAASAVGLTGLFGYVGATICGVGSGWIIDHGGWTTLWKVYAVFALVGTGVLAFTWNRSGNSGVTEKPAP